MEEEEDATFTVHDVLDAMEHLTPMYRTVFNLYVFDNLGHQEISDRLGISVGTSKSNLAKARRNLRDLLLTRKEKTIMSSDHPFDDQLKQSFDGFEPNVHANWAEFERSLDAPQAAEATSSAGRGMNRWAVAAAVAAGGALMWVAKPVVERAIVDEQDVVNTVGTEDGQSFDEAWAEFTSVTEGFVEDVLDAQAEVELVEASLAAENATEAPPKASPSESQTASDARPVQPDPSNITPALDVAENEAERMERLLAELPFDASVREACEEVEVAFELSGVDRTVSFLWNFGDGHFSSDPAPRHIFTRPGTYDITLSVRPPGEGSISTRTIQNMITVLPKPEADLCVGVPVH